MVKRKQPGRPTPPRKLVEGTRQAFDLLEQGKPSEAVEILEELDHAYPNTPEVLGTLVNAYYDLQDFHHYERAIREMARLEPRNPDLSYGLAGAYLINMRPALAIHAFQEALRRWPDHPKAAETRQDIPRLETLLREQAAHLQMSDQQVWDLMTQHDELRYRLDHGEYSQGRRVGEKLLRSYPDFIPALNNLAQIEAVDGDLRKAIQLSTRVLEIDPENIHALSNLARLHFLCGHPADAEHYAGRLKRSPATAADRWAKIAEALTFLEDDKDVLALYQRAKAAGELKPPDIDAIFYHLLAVAAMHLGKEEDAERYWQKALTIEPHFPWALENLADLKKPPHDRIGVWAYPLESWLLGGMLRELTGQLEKLKRSPNQSEAQAEISRFFEEKHPEVLFLAPHLIARGDVKAREFVVRLAAATAHPVLVSAAKEYISGRRGTYQERFEAAHLLVEANLLPAGSIKIWSGGEQREVMLLNIEISPEPEATKIPKSAHALAQEAFDALSDGDGQRAQELLEQAIAIAPDEPNLVNNLAMALDMQGQSAKSSQMVQDLHARFPDYFFGIVAAANMEALQGNLEHAHELLNQLMQRKKMHTSEFTALCRAQIQVWLAENNPEQARSWLEMMERVDPEHPDLMKYRMRIGPKQKGRR